jgi:hypothetical protein
VWLQRAAPGADVVAVADGWRTPNSSILDLIPDRKEPSPPRRRRPKRRRNRATPPKRRVQRSPRARRGVAPVSATRPWAWWALIGIAVLYFVVHIIGELQFWAGT